MSDASASAIGSLIVYVDDDAGARAAFEAAFGAEFRVLAIAPAVLPVLDTRAVAVVAIDAAAVVECHPHTASILVTKPWQHDELAQALRSASARLGEVAAATNGLVHDLRTPLMSILANAEHLQVLACKVPALREALARCALDAGQRQDLALIFDELAPLAEDLQRATRLLEELVDRLG